MLLSSTTSLACLEFLARYENPSQFISVIMNSEMQSWRQVLESLTKIVLCGKQGLALCDHRDDKISWMEDDSVQYHSNEGNFVELVRFRAEMDPVLAHHLANSPTKCTPKQFKMNWWK